MRHEELLRFFIRNNATVTLSYHQGALLWRLWHKDRGRLYRRPQWGASIEDGWSVRMNANGTWTLKVEGGG